MTQLVKTFCFHRHDNIDDSLSSNINILLELISYCSFKKYNDNRIVFFTDKLGFKIFSEIFSLDYDYEMVNGDSLFKEDLFCVPKILTYKKVNNNFIHIDCDIIFHRKFNFSFESNDILFLNSENSAYPLYHNQIRKIFIKENIYMPYILKNNYFHMNINNMGIFGVRKGLDISDYYSNSIMMYRSLRYKINKINSDTNFDMAYSCAIPEQYLMGSYIQYKKLKYSTFEVSSHSKSSLTHVHYNKYNKKDHFKFKYILSQLDQNMYLKWLDFSRKK